ncbi:SPOSA6832_04350 [Sporobolomyces salmonicolor]|uniref:SPOSA6832_04350-mRNA-1:cds n=1 Tax=Sporidiobolus salmonicolor TaxID=5005 RepID=A0A0D6ERX4_SPOSA|nr:SPOSA6832_04350 [Sporobolomyces salmonicolor]
MLTRTGSSDLAGMSCSRLLRSTEDGGERLRCDLVPRQVNVTHLAITIITLFIVFFGLFSWVLVSLILRCQARRTLMRFLNRMSSGFVKERLYVGEAIIATCFGIAFSAYGAGIFAPRTWAEGHHTDEITLELTRVIIALSVFAVGVELPKAYVLRHWRSLCMLLGPIMLFGWMIAASLMYAIIPGLEFLPALVLAAGVTPTDPILASSVVGKGKYAQEHVPSHIRHILQAESGCNDGAAFPFLVSRTIRVLVLFRTTWLFLCRRSVLLMAQWLLSLCTQQYLALFLLLRDHHSVGSSIGYWVLLVLLYQIILGCIIGAAVGIAARKVLKFSKRRELIDRESMVAMYVALALLVTGLTTLAGSDDLLAAFCCGTAFAWDDWFTESIEESNFSSTIDLLANCAIFIYLGATMPFSAWNNVYTTLNPWRLVLLCLGILTLRRLPGIYALQWWIPDIKTRREALFAGHFGPMGVGAIFISTLAASKLPTPHIPPQNSIESLALMCTPVTYCIVLSSILVHGLTISFFTLGRRVHSRVQSFSRTLTAQSTNSRFGRTFSISGRGGASEPSWMSRVKLATRAEDIVINRDEDESPESLAEKGVAEGAGTVRVSGRGSGEGEGEKSIASGSGSETAAGSGKEKEKEKEEEELEEAEAEAEAEAEHEAEVDEAALAMFGAAPDGKVGHGTKERLDQERAVAVAGKEEVAKKEKDTAEAGGPDVEKEVEDESDVQRGRIRERKHGEELAEDRRREDDDNPPKNILSPVGADVDDSDKAKAAYAAKQARKRDTGKGRAKEQEPELEKQTERPPRSRNPSPPSGIKHAAGKRDPRLEARYCRGTRTWKEGRKVPPLFSLVQLSYRSSLPPCPQIIIDHGDGEVEIIDPDASPEAARRADGHPSRRVLDVPQGLVDDEKKRLSKQHGDGDHEANAVKRVAAKMIRQGSALGAVIGKKDEGLSQEEKERRRKEKLKRDAWCRKERHYRDSSPHGRDYEEWIEGDKVGFRCRCLGFPQADLSDLQIVTERGDGSTDVREMTPEEKRARAKKHLAALRALGHPAEMLEAEFAKLSKTRSIEQDASPRLLDASPREPVASTSRGPGIAEEAQTPPVGPSSPRVFTRSPSPQSRSRSQSRSPSRSPSRPPSPAPGSSKPPLSLALTRTDRIDPSSDEEDAEAEDAVDSSRILPPRDPARPMPTRQSSSAIQAVRELFRPRAADRPAGPASTSAASRQRLSEASAGGGSVAPSIRFAAIDRPSREGTSSGTGRPLPVVGSGLGVRRVLSKRTDG